MMASQVFCWTQENSICDERNYSEINIEIMMASAVFCETISEVIDQIKDGKLSQSSQPVMHPFCKYSNMQKLLSYHVRYV